jgi:hypothetical protein
LLNSKGDKVHVRSVAEQHILEDFRQKFVPTMQDYFGNMKLLPWMDNAMGPLGTAGESSAAGKTTVKAIAVD